MRCTPSGIEPKSIHCSHAKLIGTATSTETWIGRRLLMPASTAFFPADAVRSAATLSAAAAERSDLRAIVLAALPATLRKTFDFTEPPSGVTASFAASFAWRTWLRFLLAAAPPFFEVDGRARRAGLLRCLVAAVAMTTLS